MNLFQYLSTIQRLWNNYDGAGVSKFISLSGNHASNKNLHVENPEITIERQLEPLIDEVVLFHLKTLYYLHDTRKSFS